MGLQEEGSNGAQGTVEVNQGSPWCCSLRKKTVDATVRDQREEDAGRKVYSEKQGENEYRAILCDVFKEFLEP